MINKCALCNKPGKFYPNYNVYVCEDHARLTITDFLDRVKATKKYMWEILVPTMSNEGKPFRTRYHKVWDKKVRAISGGLTIIPPIKGQWVFDDKLYSERNIPVRIACTRDEIIDIMKITKDYYDQIDILAYKVSDEVLFLSEVE